MALFTKLCLDTSIYISYCLLPLNMLRVSWKLHNNLINENIFSLLVSSLRQDMWYLEITNLFQNSYFTYKNPSITCSNWTYYTYSWCLIQHNIPCATCTILDIGCAAFWIVLVTMYPTVIEHATYREVG